MFLFYFIPFYSSHQDKYGFNQVNNELNKYIQNYEKFIFIGDFNVETLNQVCLNFYINTKIKI